MNTAQPIRNKEDINKLKIYFIKNKEYRNYLLVIIGLNTALRISDILKLRYGDIYDYKLNSFKKYIILFETKTGKEQRILINKQIKNAFEFMNYKSCNCNDYLFVNNSNVPISRIQVNRILDKASKATNIEHISCHSLRKTFGYHAWKKGAQPTLLMQIFNHCNFEITKRYLGICQEDKDELFNKIAL